METLTSHPLLQVEIRDNGLGQVPQGGLTALRNLRSLTLSKVGIVSVVSSAFGQYASRMALRRIDLSNNRLQSLMDDAFSGLDNLMELSLDKNLLSRMPTNALRPLRSLEDLSLGANRISKLEPNELPFPQLKSLSLEVNELEDLNEDTFVHTPELLYLYLGNNRFRVFDPNVFYHLRKLKVLAMGNNEQIKSIGPNAFAFVPGLVRLEMSECSLEDIAENAFSGTRNVQVLSFQGNKLRRYVHR